MRKLIDIIQFIMILFLIIFGLFIFYQIIRKIIGGSWEIESIIISLLVLIIGVIFTMSLNQIRFNIDYSYFKKEFYHLREEFTSFTKDFMEFKYKIESKV